MTKVACGLIAAYIGYSSAYLINNREPYIVDVNDSGKTHIEFESVSSYPLHISIYGKDKQTDTLFILPSESIEVDEIISQINLERFVEGGFIEGSSDMIMLELEIEGWSLF